MAGNSFTVSENVAALVDEWARKLAARTQVFVSRDAAAALLIRRGLQAEAATNPLAIGSQQP